MSSPARRGRPGNVGVLVELAQAEGWTVCVIATPNARAFLDVAALEELTGRAVRVCLNSK